MKTFVISAFAILGILAGTLTAQNPSTKTKKKTPDPSVPKPTLADVAYGPHPQQKLDFYKAESAKPTPLLFVIHGGGWRRGDKSTFNNQALYLKAGISVVSINYRFIQHGTAEKLVPPVKAPLHDAARALQLVRSKAAEWNLDKELIAATGSSAGACSSLWLAFHPDLADPKSTDPIARESTRLYCAAVVRGQTSLDPKQMREWIPNIIYGPHAFGFEAEKGDQMGEFEEFLSKRETLLPWIKEYSPYELVTSDDPPVYLYYNTAPKMGQQDKEGAHAAAFGVGLAEKLKKEGVAYELVYRGALDVKHPEVVDYVKDKLLGTSK